MQRPHSAACVGLILAVAAVAEGRRSAGPGGRAQSAVVPVGSYWELEHGALPSSEDDCDVRWIEQPLDHFSFGGRGSQATYRERYFFCDGVWNTTGNTKGPIFFYVGNEADVGLYVNATGLMWEHAARFGALMVFAEHRYYGASQPAAASPTDLAYLSHEQALADYAGLIYELKEEHDAADSAVVAFGGSYGGKLAAWMRFKYPSSVVGAISASAPLLAFRGESPGWDSGAYYRVITQTAKHYSLACADNVRAAFPALDVTGGTAAGRTSLAKLFGLCKTPDASEVAMLKFFIRDAFDSIAMGNYPWPSSYIAGDASHLMPAWPAGLACGHLADPALKSDNSRLFAAVNKAVSVLYNVTEDVDCYDLPDYPTPLTPGKPMDGIWDYQWCTEQMPDSFWFSTDGVRDMFWPNPYNATLVAEHCKLAWGEAPQTTWIATEYGGRSLGEGHSNVVFSSGGYDGWSSGGVATNITEQSLHAIFIKEGGHHLDLMFSHPDDPASVKNARAFELANVAAWINSYAGRTTMKSWGDLIR